MAAGSGASNEGRVRRRTQRARQIRNETNEAVGRHGNMETESMQRRTKRRSSKQIF